mmetsp:Transcript_17802/g.25033  ORF Transcript_17802/g.25033 Transcript_17802/m.25033 type:complete len:180 (-) Transcript_17802:297-836(-)|eukprot:CAMPEP_0175101114 /NCGR_PEP_ID=MMETSP0086_2-20121207/7573_1 /TAXON_ID=136419 /ORGANISM="Unknown Unknown, Strain D1" /LENGTH=179 /DNA_ID=CAMNT_0016375521 /DNA_START=45 /DNA_END=584 /DNA_ORIENTATION=+
MGALFAKLRETFFSKRIEVCIVGLENSGKSTFCNYLCLGQNDIQEPPTVGLNVKIFKKGGVTAKVWDIGGQAKYRPEWGRYARGCNVLTYVIDTQCPHLLPVAKKELHQLLEDRELSKLPLLILANKIDLGAKISEKQLITGLNLDYIMDNPWLILPISAKEGTHIDKALEFLISHAQK